MRHSLIWLVVAAASVLGCKPADGPGAAPLLPAAVPSELPPTLSVEPSVVPTAVPTLAPSPMAALKSGLTFLATVGPICPGPQREGQVCTMPYSGGFSVIRADGSEVARFNTDVDGRAVVDLPPGNYRVSLESGAGRSQPRGGPVEATVTAGQYTAITLELDTGMR